VIVYCGGHDIIYYKIVYFIKPSEFRNAYRFHKPLTIWKNLSKQSNGVHLDLLKCYG